jgi:hypothetical protein
MKLINLLPINTIQSRIPSSSSMKLNELSGGFNDFKRQTDSLLGAYKASLKEKLNGKTIELKGSKGYGQANLHYTVIVTDVDVTLYQNKYTVVITGRLSNERSDAKPASFYVDPSENSTIKIVKPEAPTVERKPEVAPKQNPQPQPRQSVQPEQPEQRPSEQQPRV